jgi:beta-lactamase regulating signal transducer with metallopeptidase domain
MSPELCLHFAAIFLNYFLRVAAGCLLCWLLNRLLGKPQQRFLVWLVFLLGSATYWLALIFRELMTFSSPTGGAGVVTTAIAPTGAHSFVVPLGWSHAILTVVQVLGSAYVSAALLLIGLAAWRHLRLRLLLRRAIEPGDALAGLFREICRDLGLSRGQLLVLPGLKSPATAGWWNPRILLPEVCEELGPTPQVADVLCHELIHVERRDYFWAALGNLICCLLFFHPAVWKARKWMGVQGELACDLAVLEARPGNRADYADSLAYFVRLRMLQEGFSLGVDFAASASLGLRIRAILAAPQPRPRWKRISQIAAGLALLGALGVLAPALTVLLGFASPIGEQASVQVPLQAATAHARTIHRARRREEAQPQNQDSLTTLRTRSYVPETTAYTMTARGNEQRGSDTSDSNTPAWRETKPSIQYPSVSRVVLSTLGEIAGAARGAHGGRDHDRDDH